MNPRLQSASLTEEDYEIFLERWSNADNGVFFRSCRHADCRDADLTLEAVNVSCCPIWSGRFKSPRGGRWFDRIMKARECVEP